MIEGVFRSAREQMGGATYRYFVRLYNDGYVIAVSCAADEAPPWFEWSHEGVQRGRYSLEGNAIYFELFSQAGSVYYEGHVLDRVLSLRSRSLINGYETERTYEREG